MAQNKFHIYFSLVQDLIAHGLIVTQINSAQVVMFLVKAQFFSHTNFFFQGSSFVFKKAPICIIQWNHADIPNPLIFHSRTCFYLLLVKLLHTYTCMKTSIRAVGPVYHYNMLRIKTSQNRREICPRVSVFFL